jgi:hypothetical protein
VLFLLYPAGVGTCLAALVLGYWGLGRLSRRSTAPSPRAQAIYDAIPFSGGGGRPRLRIADRLQRPVLVLLGIFRPTILIPAALDAATPGATESLRLSFLHELAHAERSDPWFSLVGSLAQAFWFFLPPVWWIRARMQLDHEFLADRRAALAFDAPGRYASSLVGMATPLPQGEQDRDRPGPSRRSTCPAEGAGSPLFQRVLMLVQCPFPVEQEPPTWWSWALPILTLLLAPAVACLGLEAGIGGTVTRPVVPETNTFRMSRLAIGPQGPGPHGRAPAVELPLRLPERFELAVEVWGDRAALARCRVVGQPLGPLARAPEASSELETWHHVLLRRDHAGLSLSVDGQPVRNDPGRDRDGLTTQLAFEPAPDRPALFRNLTVTWDSPRTPSD